MALLLQGGVVIRYLMSHLTILTLFFVILLATGRAGAVQTSTTYLDVSQIPLRIYQGAIVGTAQGRWAAGDMFASNNDTVYYSSDGGANWHPKKTFGTSYVRAGGAVIHSYFCKASHVSSTRNQPGTPGGAAYWEEVFDNPDYPSWSSASSYTGRDVSMVRIVYLDGYIYAAPVGESISARVAGVWRSADGTAWNRVQALPVGAGLYNMAKLSNGTLFFSIYSLWSVNWCHIYKSTDGGATWSIAYTPPGTLVSYGGKVYISLNKDNQNYRPDISPTWWALDPNTPVGTVGVSKWSPEAIYTVGRRHTHDIAASPDGSRIFCEIADPAAGNQLPTVQLPGAASIPDGDPAIVMSTDGTTWNNWAVMDSATWPPNPNYPVGLLVIDNNTVLTTLESVFRESILKFTDGKVTEIYHEGLNNPHTPWSYSFYIKKNPVTGSIFLPGRGTGKLRVTRDNGASFDVPINLNNVFGNVVMNNISDFYNGKALIGWQQSGSSGLDPSGLYHTDIQYAPGIMVTEKTSVNITAADSRQFPHSDLNTTFTDTNIGDTSIFRHGFAPKLSGSTSQFLRGDGVWASPPGGGILLNPNGVSKPICDSDHHGLFWVTQGGIGVKDSVEVCAKDASDIYAWRTIY